jgi:hypothetical protein
VSGVDVVLSEKLVGVQSIGQVSLGLTAFLFHDGNGSVMHQSIVSPVELCHGWC